MDFLDLSHKFEQLAKDSQEILNDALDGSLNNLYADYMDRIFNKNLKSDSTPIGKYSTKPILVGAKSFRNKGQADKFFDSEEAFTDDTQGFRTLKSKKKAYLLIGGYSKLRQIQGMPTDTVDLQYKAHLKQSINPKVTNERHAIVTNDTDNFKKMIGNDKRFGTISFLTKDERENFFKDVNRIFLDLTAKRLTA